MEDQSASADELINDYEKISATDSRFLKILSSDEDQLAAISTRPSLLERDVAKKFYVGPHERQCQTSPAEQSFFASSTHA